MIHLKPLFIFLSLFSIPFLSFSQQSFEIIDLKTKEPIPFVKIYPSIGTPFLADIDGRFNWNAEWNLVRLVYTGYADSTFFLDQVSGSKLYLTSKVQEIQEVTAVAGENPAHRIMDLVIANRKSNNPLDNDSFKYRSYSKFLVEIDEGALANISDTTTDTSLISARNFIKSNHLFLIETSSIRTFVPPSRDKEEIIAYKVSGIQDPLFATVAKEMQSFSFYENQFNILSKTYINPIAFGGTRRYLFQLQDTTYSGLDTIFHISFRPRKGKNFDGLQGTLFINTNKYAIERVIAEPYERGATDPEIKIVQEYQFINNSKWFPVKLSSELVFPQIQFTIADTNIQVVSKSSTYIDSVEINPDKVKKYYFDNAVLTVNKNAGDIKDSTWNELRKYELSEKEKNTYKTIDSLAKEANLDKYLYGLKVLATGKIPLKYLNSDLSRLFGFNEYEGFRLGLGLETSDRLFEPASLSGYFAYGFKDKAFKWGGDLRIFIYPKKSFTLKLSYRDDVFERGQRPYISELSGYSSISQLRSLYVRYMDRYRQASADLSIYATSNFRVGLETTYERIGFLQGYRYTTYQNSPSYAASTIQSFDNLTVTGSILWSIREQVVMLGNQRLSKGSRFPTLFLSASKGISGVQLSQFDYTRIYAELSHKVSIRGVGFLKYSICAGELFGQAPLTASFGLFNSFSRNSKLNLSISNTFETLDNVGYYFRRNASVFSRFDFNKWKKYKKFQPQFGIHNAIGFGNRVNSLGQNIPIEGLEKGHFESGLIINNLFSNIGVGFFYKYGAYKSVDEMRNLFVKLSVSFTF